MNINHTTVGQKLSWALTLDQRPPSPSCRNRGRLVTFDIYKPASKFQFITSTSSRVHIIHPLQNACIPLKYPASHTNQVPRSLFLFFLGKSVLVPCTGGCKCRGFAWVPSRPEDIGEFWFKRRRDFDVSTWRCKCRCKHTHEQHDPNGMRRCKAKGEQV